MDPRNPDVMYAVTWQRMRNVAVVMDGGPGTGIHKSAFTSQRTVAKPGAS
jgi:hypothetical protein